MVVRSKEVVVGGCLKVRLLGLIGHGIGGPGYDDKRNELLESGHGTA